MRIIELNNILEEINDRQKHVQPIENQDEELDRVNVLIEMTKKLLSQVKKDGN